uniref:Hypotheticial protein n=1 Tax=Schistosoma japonicum TaxID=6182 RepID=C7TYG9_SCHJA|nr:hypotheticial protein [Schistosoma japonicum]
MLSQIYRSRNVGQLFLFFNWKHLMQPKQRLRLVVKGGLLLHIGIYMPIY